VPEWSCIQLANRQANFRLMPVGNPDEDGFDSIVTEKIDACRMRLAEEPKNSFLVVPDHGSTGSIKGLGHRSLTGVDSMAVNLNLGRSVRIVGGILIETVGTLG
jgi:hypothetical protein